MKIYIISGIILAVFFISISIWHYVQMKKRNRGIGVVGIELIFILLILLGMMIVQEISDDYKKTITEETYYTQQNIKPNNTISNSTESVKYISDESELINNLISMQANTLAVTAIIITIACIIISILTIYRERKVEINNEKIEKSINKLNETEKIVQEISAISSIMLLSEGQREIFVSIIREKIEKLSVVKEYSDIAYAHFQMIIMNMLLYEQHYMPNKSSDYKKYDEIIKRANDIINNDKSTDLSSSFAYIERVHAAYQKLKSSTDTNKYIKENITTAHAYLDDLKRQKFPDSNGHISNLTGLIELWTGIAKIRFSEINNSKKDIIEECLEYFNNALDYFKEAIEKNPIKVEFKNHKVVTLLRLSDIEADREKKSKLLNESMKVCKEIIQDKPSYLKAHINLADTIIRKIRFSLDISSSWDSSINHELFNYTNFEGTINTEKLNTINNDIQEAQEALNESIKIDNLFPNSYYKTAELDILKLFILITNHQPKENEIEQLKESIENNLGKAAKIIGNIDKIDVYRYSYLKFLLKYYDNNDEEKNKIENKMVTIENRRKHKKHIF